MPMNANAMPMTVFFFRVVPERIKGLDMNENHLPPVCTAGRKGFSWRSSPHTHTLSTGGTAESVLFAVFLTFSVAEKRYLLHQKTVKPLWPYRGRMSLLRFCQVSFAIRLGLF